MSSKFFHYIVESYILAFPEEFLQLVNKKTGWAWSRANRILYIRGEPALHESNRGASGFYDALIIVERPLRKQPGMTTITNIFVEIKTGKYVDSWIHQLEVEYRGRSSSLRIVPRRYRGWESVLVWLLWKDNMELLKRNIRRRGLRLSPGHFFVFPLDEIVPHVKDAVRRVLNG